jgi:hypothetical protein
MKPKQPKLPTRITALALVLMVFVLGLASVYPELHGALHVDDACATDCGKPAKNDEPGSGEHSHSCAVTLLQAATIFYVDRPIFDTIGKLLAFVERSDSRYTQRAPFSLPSGRAPPIAGIV